MDLLLKLSLLHIYFSWYRKQKREMSMGLLTLSGEASTPTADKAALTPRPSWVVWRRLPQDLWSCSLPSSSIRR